MSRKEIDNKLQIPNINSVIVSKKQFIEYAVVSPNNSFDFNNHEKWIEYYEKRDSFMNDSVSIRKGVTEKNEYINDIWKIIRTNILDIGNTVTLAMSEEYVYQLMYIHQHKIFSQLKENNNLSKENDAAEIIKIDLKKNNLKKEDIPVENKFINMLLQDPNVTVYGKAVILKHKINLERTCDEANINKSDVAELFRDRLYHISIFIGSEAKTGLQVIEEIQLYNNINLSVKQHLTEILKKKNINIKKIEANKIISTELKLLCEDAYMFAIFELNNNEFINKLATRLAGRIIRGDVVLCSEDSTGLYQNIYKKEIIKLANICCFQRNQDQINKELSKKTMSKGSREIIRTRYYYLDLYTTNLIKKCIKCKESIQIDNRKTCSGCYRATYCSLKCQKDDWTEHSKECSLSVHKRNIIFKEKQKAIARIKAIINCVGYYNHDLKQKMIKYIKL